MKKNNADILISVEEDKTIPPDGYRIVCGRENISVRAINERGVIFAVDLLLSRIEKCGKDYRLPLFTCTDYPSFTMRGIIEGYYGLPWTDEIRKDVAAAIRHYRMNTYWYAPKNDPFHRQDWRLLYEGEFWEDLISMIRYCKEQNVDFCYCISPMLDFNPQNEADYQALFTKIEQVLPYGIRHFGLLFDDIEEGLSARLKEHYLDAGQMHAQIANRLNAFLKAKLESYTLSVCPTEYYDSKVTGYKTSLAAELAPEIKIIWTGYHTIAEVISDEESRSVKELYGHDLVLWDNYPVNDFIFDRVFMGGLDNRSECLCETHWGMVMNPMGLWYASKPALYTAGEYMWNAAAYRTAEAERRACKNNIEERYAEDLYTVLKANAWSVFSDRYRNYFDKILAAGPKSVARYYKKLLAASKNIARSKQNPLLAEELESWFDKIAEECRLAERLVAGIAVDETQILDCLNANIQLGTTLFRDFVLLYGYLSRESYESKVISDQENYYKRLTMRPRYWKI